MKKLRLTLALFGILIALPLAFVAWRTFGSLDRESRAQVRFFGEQLLDEIEAELARLVRLEEDRAVDEYRPTMVQTGGAAASPLAHEPAENYILGYFQNNPDGSFQTPLVEVGKEPSSAVAWRVAQLQDINRLFNQRKRLDPGTGRLDAALSPPGLTAKKESSDFAERFLKASPSRKDKSVLGQEQARVEEITAGQAMNLVRQEIAPPAPILDEAASQDHESEPAKSPMGTDRSALRYAAEKSGPVQPRIQPSPADLPPSRFQVEVAPLQTVVIDGENVYVFRRIAIEGQIYRQGVVLKIKPFLDHLLATLFRPQPISRYTRLQLYGAGISLSSDPDLSATDPSDEAWVTARTFPAPFNFLTARIQIESLPPSPARRALTLALSVLGVVMVVGLVLIDKNARAVLDLSERRSRFVSAVTHELKTPLTNIRMYVEMLEQGIAATPEREREYVAVLAAESARLSGLINNVLELARLEKQTRRFNLREGDLSDVLAEVQSVMAEQLAREGFELAIDNIDRPVFAYDREVLVQVLVNLMENSIKFGRHLSRKQIHIMVRAADEWVRLMVSDTGPGIPRQSLRKVFEDFYRVDSGPTRTVGGTGIGLALVKRLILAMGGRIRAENNPGPGCTMIISLPANRQAHTP